MNTYAIRSALCFLVLCTMTESSVAAKAGVVIGQPCTAEGVSTITDDNVNLAVCLRESATSATLFWKSMSGGGSNMAPCGTVPHGTVTWGGNMGEVSEDCWTRTYAFGITQCQNGKLVTMPILNLSYSTGIACS